MKQVVTILIVFGMMFNLIAQSTDPEGCVFEGSLYSDSSEVIIGLPFVLYIKDNGTGNGCVISVQYPTQTGNPFPAKPNINMRLLDNYTDIIDQGGAGLVQFTQNTVNFSVNRSWVEAVYESSTGGAVIVIRDNRTRFFTDEDYDIIRARFIVCPPTYPPNYLIDAENGLYVANDTTVRMGGFLIENTRVQLEGYPLTFIDTTAKQSFGVGAGTLPGYLGDTVGYFARRSGGFRQFILQGNRYNQIVIRDTSSVFGDYAEIYQGLYFGDKPFMYFDVTDREFDGKISRISIDADSVSFRNSPYLSSIDAYIRYFTAKAGRISMGAIEGELGITGTGVEMGAYGYGVGGGASEYLFMKTKAVDNGTASVGQYLKLLNTSTGEAEWATIDPVDSSLYATRYWTSSNFFPLEGGTLTGTGGAGFIGFPSQVSAPGTPSSGLNVYAQGSSFNWKGTDGFERQFGGTLTGGRSYTLPDINGTLALGTGTTDRSARWSGSNTLAAGNITDNGTKLEALKPWQFQSWTTAGRPTGVTGYIGDNITNDWIERYSSTAGAWISPLQSSLTGGKGTATRVPFFDANGRIIDNNALRFAPGTLTLNSPGAFDRISLGAVSNRGEFGYGASGAGFVHPTGGYYAFAGTGFFLGRVSQHYSIMGVFDTTVVVEKSPTINGTSSSAIFMVNSTTKGILPPRWTSAQRTAIVSPTTGIFGYQTDGTEGVYFRRSSSWGRLLFESDSWITSNYTSSSGLTTNRIPKFNGTSFVNSSWSEDGTQILALNNLPVRAKDVEVNCGIIELSAGFGAPAIRSRANDPTTSDNNGLQIISEDAGSIIFTTGRKNNSGWVEVARMDTTGTKYRFNSGAIPSRPPVLAYTSYFAGSATDTLITGTYQFTQDRTFQILGDGTGIFPKIVGRGYGLGNKEASDLSKTQSAYIASWATDGTLLDYPLSSLGNGIYGGSATLSQHTTRARVPDNGNLYFSQTYNGGADSTYWQIVNYGGGERALNFGLTDTSSTGYSRAQFYSDGTGAMNWGLETSDALFGNTLVRAFDGDLLLSTSEGQISLAAPVDSELSMTGMVKAKQEAYYEINSTSSPQNLSNVYSDNFINQGATQATFTLVFPASPEDGQVLTITYNNNISTLTLDGNGNTIVGTTVTTAVAGSQRKFKFYAGEGVWIRIY